MGNLGSKNKGIELTVLVEYPFSMTSTDLATPLNDFINKYSQLLSKQTSVGPYNSMTRIDIGLNCDRDKAMEAEQYLKRLYQERGINITAIISG